MNMRVKQLLVASLVWISAMLSGISQVAADAKPASQPDPEQLVRDWEAKLDGSEWTIQLSPATGTGKSQTDTLTFAHGTVSSKWLSKEGFAPSNYTLSAQDASHAEWQTTQSNPDGHVASWRSQLSGDTISGALNKRTPDGQAMVFYVNGTKAASAPPPPPLPKPEAPKPDPLQPAVVAPATPPVVQQQPKPQASQPQAPVSAPQEKKKWGWW